MLETELHALGRLLIGGSLTALSIVLTVSLPGINPNPGFGWAQSGLAEGILSIGIRRGT